MPYYITFCSTWTSLVFMAIVGLALFFVFRNMVKIQLPNPSDLFVSLIWGIIQLVLLILSKICVEVWYDESCRRVVCKFDMKNQCYSCQISGEVWCDESAVVNRLVNFLWSLMWWISWCLMWWISWCLMWWISWCLMWWISWCLMWWISWCLMWWISQCLMWWISWCLMNQLVFDVMN